METEVKLENSKAWNKFKHLINLNDKNLLKYKSLDFALKHIECSNNFPKIINYEYDGIMLILYYKEGVLKHAVTQGSDNIGSDIFVNAFEFKGIPQTINNEAKNIIVKGILSISHQNYKKLCEESDNIKYTNCRYATVGIARRLDGDKANLLTFFAYNIFININNTIEELKDTSILKNLGFYTPNNLLKNESQENYINILKHEYEYAKKVNAYPVTGLIVKSDSYEFILKITPNSMQTKILSYDWTLSSTNKLIPTVNFKPVEIEGSVISKASISSAKNYVTLNAPEGSVINVVKTEGVLPMIEGVVGRPMYTELSIPRECPVCGETLKWKGSHLICDNLNCKNRLISHCSHIVNILHVPRFTDKLLIDLININKIKNVQDIFKLNPEDILSVKFNNRNISSKQALILIESVNNRIKELKDVDFINCLNLPKITPNIIEKIKEYAKENNTTLLNVFEKNDMNILSKVLKEDKIKTILSFMENQKDLYYSLKEIILGC